ncbi:diguanylate cyclase [Paraglaciecola sp. 2405UD69-4]|uniref:diguanylate cyclase n=1 Tax=Paraglaciecola sp. 2405UD69-4 TaxID=3391836 RepID=UPI0039C93882
MIVTSAKNAPRISLVTVFSVGFISIILVFILLSYFTFSRILSFESVLTNVSDESLPQIIEINQLYTQAASLSESIEILSQSSSIAAKRLATTRLQTNLLNTRKAAKEIFGDEYLYTQLNTITLEINELSILIDERQKARDSIAILRDQVYQLNNQAILVQAETSDIWSLIMSQAVVNVGNALNENRLQQVRYLFNKLKQQLNLIESEKVDGKKQQLTNKLKTILFGTHGLEELKIKSLRLSGRTIGRANFVQSLIKDYVTQLGFVADKTSKRITKQVSSSVVEMKQQTQLIRLVLIGGVIFLLITFFMFQKRVLNRISVFNQIVRNKALGKHSNTELTGNDEITDLAKTFQEFTKTIELQKQKLEHLSMSDGLTGIANRRALDIRLKRDLELSKREKYCVSILLMDIDNFKRFNDNYGHAAGDKCLQDVSTIISNTLQRDCDFVARYGGEEFICVLVNTDTNGAQKIAAEIITQITGANIPHEYSEIADRVTLSIGIETSTPTCLLTTESIIKRADTALYDAKKSGKNTYKIYG